MIQTKRQNGSVSPHGQLAAVTATSRGIGASHAGAFAADDPREREAEVLAEEGVDARVYRGIEVAQPEKHAEDGRMDAVREERAQQVHAEEGQPADDETADDDAQRLRRLGLHAESLRLTIHDSSLSFTRNRASEQRAVFFDIVRARVCMCVCVCMRV